MILFFSKCRQVFLQAMQQHRTIMYAILFCFLLIIIRIWFTDANTYIFLVWNLFLAFLPFLFSLLFAVWPSLWENKKSRYVLSMVWLVFLPNSFYIVTDLFHLRHISSVPVWFDTLLIYAFAWAGIMMGVASIQNLERMAKLEYGTKWANRMLVVLLFLVSIGVYMGRNLRFNTWDVVFNPFAIFSEVIPLVINPVSNYYVWDIIGLYGMLFYIVYKSLAGSR